MYIYFGEHLRTYQDPRVEHTTIWLSGHKVKLTSDDIIIPIDQHISELSPEKCL